jgi:predicted nucleotidyltransferase
LKPPNWFMTNTLLDFSLRPELALHARVVADVEAAVVALGTDLGIKPIIAGAFARDLHLQYGHGIALQRKTEDIDFALAVPDWETFAALREQLTKSGAFTGSTMAAHRLRHHSSWPVDLVPFGGVESPDRKIAWPPRQEFSMDVFGFQEALACSVAVLLPGKIKTRVVSLAALALLKIVCWQDRHYASPRKDAYDLQMILSHYLAAGNEPRLWDEFVEWAQDDDFDYELAGPRMLGQDIRQMLDQPGLEQVIRVLLEQTDAGKPGLLPNEMNSADPDRAAALLKALLRGIRTATICSHRM